MRGPATCRSRESQAAISLITTPRAFRIRLGCSSSSRSSSNSARICSLGICPRHNRIFRPYSNSGRRAVQLHHRRARILSPRSSTNLRRILSRGTFRLPSRTTPRFSRTPKVRQREATIMGVEADKVRSARNLSNWVRTCNRTTSRLLNRRTRPCSRRSNNFPKLADCKRWHRHRPVRVASR
jgi:hypothetical protein